MKKDEIIKRISSFNGKYSPYSVFYDWVTCCALAITNACSIHHDEVWKKREQEYMQTINKYDKKEQEIFSEMFVMLVDAYEERIEDVLGDVYMKSGCYNKALGQFFTPYHLAELTAQVGLGEIKTDEILPINEPSVGGGANIIAVAKILNDRNINYQKIMKVTAQDLDWLAVYMSYVQFSMLGIDARVVQGDTLCEPYDGNNYPPERIFDTPKAKGVLL